VKHKTRKQIYFLGALWNLAFAVSGLVLPGFTMWLISGSADAITGVLARTFFSLFWVSVGLFGTGYYLVSRDPDRNEAVIWTGCIGKMIVFLTLGNLYFCNQAALFGFMCGFGDFIWIFLFVAAQKREKAKRLSSFT
jgi:hypothetical protein